MATVIKYIIHNGKALNINKDQTLLVLNFAMMNYNFQSRIGLNNVFNLKNCKNYQLIYTCLFLGSNYGNTAIIQEFDDKENQK